MKQFDSVMQKGRFFQSTYFSARVLRTDLGTRFAAVVPQKLAKTAVLRNKTRRMMYEAIRPLLDSVAPGFDVVVFAKKIVLDSSFADISKGMNNIFVISGILK